MPTDMNKLDKMYAFLSFWFSPWGAAKGAKWEAFTGDQPIAEHVAYKIMDDIYAGIDTLNWDAIND